MGEISQRLEKTGGNNHDRPEVLFIRAMLINQIGFQDVFGNFILTECNRINLNDFYPLAHLI